MAQAKEIMDVLKLARKTGEFLKTALGDDGRITITDALKAVPLLMALKDAVSGVQSIPTEVKHLDSAALEQIATEALGVVTVWAGLFTV